MKPFFTYYIYYIFHVHTAFSRKITEADPGRESHTAILCGGNAANKREQCMQTSGRLATSENASESYSRFPFNSLPVWFARHDSLVAWGEKCDWTICLKEIFQSSLGLEIANLHCNTPRNRGALFQWKNARNVFCTSLVFLYNALGITLSVTGILHSFVVNFSQVPKPVKIETNVSPFTCIDHFPFVASLSRSQNVETVFLLANFTTFGTFFFLMSSFSASTNQNSGKCRPNRLNSTSRLSFFVMTFPVSLTQVANL